MSETIENIKIKGAKILFRNFSGKPDKFNANGEKNFVLLIPFELEQDLIKDGWNIKHLKPRDEDEAPQPYLPVAVSYKNERYLPIVKLITKRGIALLNDDTISNLDSVEIKKIDIVVRPRIWQKSTGESGVKAYVKTMYVTAEEDEFANDYEDYESGNIIEDDELPFA